MNGTWIRLASGVRIHCYEAGTGPALVLVHGWPAGASVWRAQLKTLSRSYHVLAPDLPGFGSSPAVHPTSLSTMAGVVEALIVERALTDVVLVGWSMGGRICMSYCERREMNRVRGVCFADTGPTMLRASGDAMRDGWLRGRREFASDLIARGFADPAQHRAEIDALVDEAQHTDETTALALIDDACSHDFRDALRKIGVPSLLLFGSRSRNTTGGTLAELAGVLPGSRVMMLERAAHYIMLDASDGFDKALDEFVVGLEPTTQPVSQPCGLGGDDSPSRRQGFPQG